MNAIDKLLSAARRGDIELAQEYIEEGTSVNVRDKKGTTPLYNAVFFHHTEAVEFFIRQNADVNAQNSQGNTPLHISTSVLSETIAACLLDHNANVNVQNKDGSTPLHTAILYRSQRLFELFLARGATISTKDNDGNTPLHLAAGRSLSMTTMLLERCANITCRNKEGYSPLHQAATSRLTYIVQLLLQRGAYSYRCDKADHILCDYWKRPQINTPENLYFYTTLLLSGVSMQGKVLPEPLKTRQSNIVWTVKNWFSGLNLSIEKSHELTPGFLRALPQLLHWLKKWNKAEKTTPLFSALQGESDQEIIDNETLFANLNKAMPRELLLSIAEDFTQQSLTRGLVNALIETYALPSYFADYFVQDCMKDTKRYTERYQRLFDHDWETSLLDSDTDLTADALSTMQNLRL